METALLEHPVDWVEGAALNPEQTNRVNLCALRVQLHYPCRQCRRQCWARVLGPQHPLLLQLHSPQRLRSPLLLRLRLRSLLLLQPRLQPGASPLQPTFLLPRRGCLQLRVMVAVVSKTAADKQLRELLSPLPLLYRGALGRGQAPERLRERARKRARGLAQGLAQGRARGLAQGQGRAPGWALGRGREWGQLQQLMQVLCARTQVVALRRKRACLQTPRRQQREAAARVGEQMTWGGPLAVVVRLLEAGL